MIKFSKKTIISIVSYPFLPAKFGGQKGIALFYKYISKEIDIVSVTTQKNDEKQAEGYKIMNILSNSSQRYINVFYFFTLRKIIKQYNSKCVLLEHPYYGWLALLLKYFCNIKLVVHSHNIESVRWKSLGKWWWKIMWHYEKLVHRNADHNFFITDEDLQFAIDQYGIDKKKGTTITYGIEWEKAPSYKIHLQARQELCTLHAIDPAKKILLFNGAFNYKPNVDALYAIIDKLHPILQRMNFYYEILICGKDIPTELLEKKYINVNLVGFVNNIDLYFQGADLFLNPILDGGGIKTKLVEALGNNMSAVSTESGAIGVNVELCNGKLQILKNEDWQAFAEAIYKAPNSQHNIGPEFYDHFYWGNIAKKAAQKINNLS